ncbi:hypothetical protein SASPL_136917 [Salvia splendens]|uniref:FGFR1 oncogene partner n=1 Tax=Salvia splendens TaxID=180675 RepID=A0A8X8X255_SALSN|nr:hypothetical protein SASPL_136917 [Salvia splendens]
MDDYTREMMDLKTLVTRTLEKKGVLAKIRVSIDALVDCIPICCDNVSQSSRFELIGELKIWLSLVVFVAELRASVFEAIEEEDKVIEKEDGLPPALLGSCNDRAKQLHNSPSGRLLTALICEYLDWSQLNHTLKVYLPESNMPKDSWKSELKDFSSKNGYDLNRHGDSGPLLLDVLEGFLKFEHVSNRIKLVFKSMASRNLSQGRGANRRSTASDSESLSNLEARNARRPSPPAVAVGIPQLGRHSAASQSSDRRAGSSASGYRRDEYNRRYENDGHSEDVIRASAALENLQLERNARRGTSSWRRGGDDMSEDNSTG